MGHATRDESVEEILDRLRSRGLRRTPGRRAVIEALKAAESHLTAEEIAVQVHARHPDLNISTVYRTLDVLEELGVVGHAHMGHGRAVYHLTERSHAHLFCEACGRVDELPLVELGGLLERLERRFGFRGDAMHFAIVGVCRDCQDGASSD